MIQTKGSGHRTTSIQHFLSNLRLQKYLHSVVITFFLASTLPQRKTTKMGSHINTIRFLGRFPPVSGKAPGVPGIGGFSVSRFPESLQGPAGRLHTWRCRRCGRHCTRLTSWWPSPRSRGQGRRGHRAGPTGTTRARISLF